ncbi:hypothetical protein K432DRAFT_113155 [Lepidopterella palustris CBS 459.81]|uniref:Uncharacterized protein n=1 Tax=Lepidopterella palustris CBS 459.81 TaxID=1314670 RepID=A0A8E2JCN8_9PEZI|nr:hypothetical protein K432DRAFT_113155 [Lepidopterella palustris CBS 459.81]
MAEQITQDVVKEAQSMGDSSSIDATATTTKNSAGDGEALSNSTTANPKPLEVLPTPSPNVIRTNEPDGVVSTEKADEDTLLPETSNSLEPQDNDVLSRVLKEHLVNGDSGEHSASEHVLADASGGSDTDISRPGSVDQAKERPGRHMRSNSVKKLASFKSVSVTKNFLAKTIVSATTPRPGEKVPPPGQTNAAAQQTARPRLVAKSGSGLGTVPRSLSMMNGAGSGPNASKVWNKNQPVPPPPPKQFTDEELKQQYGIHLATRLQADDSGKEAKWADIDDDEDDWAPETVEWMDGTKSTVTAAENQPPPVEEPKVSTGKETPTEDSMAPPASSISLQRPSSTSGTKTILKPGGHTLGTSTKSGLVLKGAPEKPTLVAKPPAPAAVKSPWAPLPPVDKVSPLQINPPIQPQSQPRFSQRDPHGFESLPPAPAAAKEFAPDDFNRSWRDDRGNKELFNSHSGRYEPVNEMRRGSFRDNNVRQPSVLQRPTQHNGPAEPSAAFQTSRSSVVDGQSWGRRRNSSNVSGGSGRRTSFVGRPSDLPPMPLDMQHRRESLPFTGSDIATPTSTPRPGFSHRSHIPERGISPAEHHQSWTQRSSPNVSYVQPVSPYGSVGSSGAVDVAPGPTMPIEDAVERQKRLMREKLERARIEKQRQQEEEAKEEAARKERLRLKMASMGLGDASKDKPKEISPSRAGEKSPQKGRALPAPLQSPPKPPVPTSEGEIAQYGMMKLHQPHPVRKLGNLPEGHIPELRPISKSLDASESSQKLSPSPVKSVDAGVQPKSMEAIENHGPSEGGLASPTVSTSNQPLQSEQSKLQQSEHGAHPSGAQNTGDRPSQTWNPSIPSHESSTSSTAWNNSQFPNHSSSSNVWGPPQHRDRALGNGTFDTNYNRGHPRPASHQPSQSHPAPPGPIAPPTAMKLSPAQAQAQVVPSHSQPFTQQPIFMAPSDLRPQPSNGLGEMSNSLTAANPGPIAPPPKASVPAPKGQWGNFANVIQQNDVARVAKWREEYEKNGGASYRPQLRETYRQTKPTGDGINRNVVKARSVVHNAEGGNITPAVTPAREVTPEVKPAAQLEVAPPQPVQTQPAPAEVHPTEVHPNIEASVPVTSQPVIVDHISLHQVAAPTANLHAPTQGGRSSSRFFPRAVEAPSFQASNASQKSDSPPPPETSSHPAFDGDVEHPIVNLPVPKARVKLPPPVLSTSTPAPVIMPARDRTATAPVGHQPIAATQDWQARFNGLFKKTPIEQAPAVPAPPSPLVATHPKSASLAVTSASKAPLDVPEQVDAATVSLPITPTKRSFVIDDGDDSVSRVTAEEALFEDREFGSLPVVNLPKVPHIAADEPSVLPPTTRPNSKYQRLVETVSKPELDISDVDPNAENVDVNIRLGNMAKTVQKTMSRRRNRKPSGYSKKRSFPPRDGNSSSQSPRPRKSSNYQAQGGSSQTPSPRPAGAGNSPRTSTAVNGPRSSTGGNGPRPTGGNGPRPSTGGNTPRSANGGNTPRPSSGGNGARPSNGGNSGNGWNANRANPQGTNAWSNNRRAAPAAVH